MNNWTAILVPIAAALIGGIASFLASYVVEKKKWTADAAIDRKSNIYAPIYDELAIIIEMRSTEHGRIRRLHKLTLKEWVMCKDRADELIVPKNLVNKLNSLLEKIELYNEAREDLMEELKNRYTESHVDRYDYGVIFNLAEAQLAGSLDLDEFYKALVEQNPTAPDPSLYWSEDRINSEILLLSNIAEWTKLQEVDNSLGLALEDAHQDLAKRIARITSRFQKPKRNL